MLYFIRIICLLLMPTTCFGWGWYDVKSQLLEKNPDLRIQRDQKTIAYDEFRIAKGQQLPQFTFRAGTRRFLQEDFTFALRSFVGPRISLTIFDGRRLVYNKRRASVQYEEQTIAEVQQAYRTLQNVRIAYADLLYSIENIKLAKEILERAVEKYRIVDLRYKSGLEFRWVWLNSKADVKVQELDVRRAKFKLMQAKQDLELLIGPMHWDLENIEDTLQHQFDVPSLILEANQSNMTQHPTYQIFQARQEQSQLDRKIAKSNMLPSIQFTTDFLLIDQDDEPVIPFWSANVGLSIPLWEGNQNRKNVDIAKLSLHQSEVEKARQLQQLQQDLEQQKEAVEIQNLRVEIAELNVEAAQDRLRVVSEQYRNGVESYDDWNRSVRYFNNEKRDLLNSRRNLMVEISRLRQLMGEDF